MLETLLQIGRQFVAALAAQLQGPFGGLFGGAVSFLLLEIGYRSRRERHLVADALAAELSEVAGQLDVFIKDQDPSEIPPYYRTSHVVFDSLVSRIAALRFEDVVSISRVYRTLDELNRMPAAWRERAFNALALPIGHPDKDSEFKAIEEGRKGFYGLLPNAQRDCRGLAVQLRTKYALDWRSLIPLRLRPTKELPP